MKLHICKAGAIAGTDRSIPDWSIAEEMGHEVNGFPYTPGIWKPDAIISMSISQMEETFAAIELWSDVPFYCYNWDCYEWVWDNPRPGEYDYNRYGELLRKATKIWVPSECTGRRTKQWWGLDNWEVILSSVPYWDHYDVRDDGYALCCLREIPDPWWGMFKKACEELGIPYKMPKHEASYEEYQDLVAGCRFLCAPLYELSTGGLSLMEGYYLGKPCLISDSEWNGGRDYMGNRARYFKYGDFEDFKWRLESMGITHYPDRLGISSDHKEYITTNFSDQRMVDDMLKSMQVPA